jgi:hypothetical protein
MKRHVVHVALMLTIVLALAAPVAAQTGPGLLRVGPVSDAAHIGGFPLWYQDKTGLVLEFCAPNAAELPNGWCLLLTGDTVAPETFPSPFSDEHFYYSIGADWDAAVVTGAFPVAAIKSILWEAAVEAAFAVGPPIPGDQTVFTRIRIRVNPEGDELPFGEWRFIHPYGEDVVIVDAGNAGRIFETEDIGILCERGKFDCAMNGRVGPFLLPSNTAGGAELAAVDGPNGKYIADPGRVGPITGSALGADRNKVRIEYRADGPGTTLTGAYETVNFSLMGRIYQGPMPGNVNVERATYGRNGSGQTLDVFATGFSTLQGRIPPATGTAVTPVLSYYDAMCSGTIVVDAQGVPTGDIAPPYGAPIGATKTAMVRAGTSYWGRSTPADIPANMKVCVEDTNARTSTGQQVTQYFPQPVSDRVDVTSVIYDPATQTLSVIAQSSDETVPPVLSLPQFALDLQSPATFNVASLAAPPSHVHVTSSALGQTQREVVVGAGAGTPSGPTGVADSFTVAEDSGATDLDVLANDQNAAGGTIAIVDAPQLGTATVNGSVVSYTPNANASGTDGFTYTVTTASGASQETVVTINITPVNDTPVAVDDSTQTVAGVALNIDVTANDTDVDGAADITSVNVLSQPAQGSAVANGKSVTFTPPASVAAATQFTFTYQAVDSAGATSNTATVTVTVNPGAAESITVTANEALFRTTKRRWVISGTDSIAGGQTLTFRYAPGSSGAGTVIGTTTVQADGSWLYDVVGVSGTSDPRTFDPDATAVEITSSLGATVVVPIRQRL